MRFLVDAQLPRRIARWLRDAGFDAVHTLDLPEANRTPDNTILCVAKAEQRVVVTKDADFVSAIVAAFVASNFVELTRTALIIHP